MFEQFFMPLERHFDGGFHATGDAFKSAAEKLSGDSDRVLHASNAHLPVNYLYRHAIELYLKSMILTVTRVVEKKNVPLDPTELRIRLAKDRPLTSVHSLKTLLEEVQRLITVNSAEIMKLTPNDWSVPSELQSWIATIEQHDSGSTFSRYPTSRSALDSAKSSFQSIDLDALAKKMEEQTPDAKGQFVLLMKNDANEIVEAFNLRDKVLPELREALVEASNLLSGSVFGLQAELVEGYGWKIQQWRSEAGVAAAKAESEQTEDTREVKPDFDCFFEHLEPRLGEITEAAQQMLGVEPVLVCCDAAKITGAHPVVLDLFQEHGPKCIFQLSDTLFCLPVSNRQFRQALEKYSEHGLNDATEVTATGVWIMCFEGNAVYIRPVKIVDEAASAPDDAE